MTIYTVPETLNWQIKEPMEKKEHVQDTLFFAIQFDCILH